MSETDDQELKAQIRDHYAERAVAATQAQSCGCGCSCGSSTVEPQDEFEANLVTQIGELREELNYLYKQINQPGNRRLPELQRELHERENKVLEVTRHQRRCVHSKVRAPTASPSRECGFAFTNV